MATFQRLWSGLSGPLSGVPGPFLNRFTYWPIRFASLGGRRLYYVHALHQHYGACVRVSPTEVAINEIASAKEIHRVGSGFTKAPWYTTFNRESRHDHERGIFAILSPKLHAERRKLLSYGFSQKALRGWEDILQTKVKMAIAGIQADLKKSGEADILAWLMFMVRLLTHYTLWP